MQKSIIILLTFTLMSVILCAEGWAQVTTSVRTNSTTDDELNLFDVLVARPLGVVAGIAGTGVFIATLPFTIPTASTGKAAKMFIAAPFRFSFSRPVPDEDLKFE